MTRYRCREHYEPVTWRGTGCRACHADDLNRRREIDPRLERFRTQRRHEREQDNNR